jgi:hypothetical protein
MSCMGLLGAVAIKPLLSGKRATLETHGYDNSVRALTARGIKSRELICRVVLQSGNTIGQHEKDKTTKRRFSKMP